VGSKCQNNFRIETETEEKERVAQKYTQLRERDRAMGMQQAIQHQSLITDTTVIRKSNETPT